MPVYKRAARPTAARASADPRRPQLSDSEFTVLFDRAPERMRNFVPVAPAAPEATRRAIERPAPAPRLPAAQRQPPPSPLVEDEDRGPRPQMAPVTEEAAEAVPVPVVHRIERRDRIETVLVPPPLRRRVVRVAVFLALGTVFGLGIELGLRSEVMESLDGGRVEARPPPVVPIPPAELQRAEVPREAPARRDEALLSAGAPAPPVVIVDEKALVTHAAHHHRGRHDGATVATVASSAASTTMTTSPVAASSPEVAMAPVTAIAIDGGEETDDLAAAVQALSRAKEEVTLP